MVELAVESSPKPTVLVGDVGACSIGDTVEVTGHYSDHPRYGRRLQIVSIRWVPPVTREGMRRFLVGGAIPGVGETLAERILDHFGDDAFALLDADPGRVKEVSGIGKAKARQIVSGWEECRSRMEESAFLAELGLGPGTTRKLRNALGDQAAEKIRENPYALVHQVEGIGFRRADQIARGLAIASDSPQRVAAGLQHVLQTQADQGHVFSSREDVVRAAAELLGIARGLVEDAIDGGLSGGQLRGEELVGDLALYAPWFHRVEQEVSAELMTRCSPLEPAERLDVEWVRKFLQPRLSIRLTEGQSQALDVLLNHRVAVLTGGPGVGKTTLVRALFETLSVKEWSLALAAPTGRAARRLAEACDHEASTIHRLLRFNPHTGQFEHHRDNPLPLDALLIDEASMVDMVLMRDLLRALPPHARFLLVGDADQLPSVGAGDVLRSIVDSEAIPVARLHEILRQKEGSTIVQAAHRVLTGQEPEFQKSEGEGAFFVPKERGQDAQDLILDLVQRRLPQTYGLDARRDIQVLAPMHRGVLGVQELNRKLKEALNPTGELDLGPGDRVLQTENDYELEVFNGEIGTVVTASADKLSVQYPDRVVHYAGAARSQLTLAYAITVHKSQGCEFPAVILPLAMQHSLLLRRNLFYTAITRAKQVLVVVGDPRALRRAVEVGTVERRRSLLEARLRGHSAPFPWPPFSKESAVVMNEPRERKRENRGALPPSAKPRLPILYEDEDVVVIDKPAGLASVASPGVRGRTCLSELRVSHSTAQAVHRLDRETSGVMIFALSDSHREALIELFRSRKVKKTYLALVRGRVKPATGEIRKPIHDRGARAEISHSGAPAHTRYRVLQPLDRASWVEVQPVTGRYNQIRLHFASIGHPLIGERKYARGKESPWKFKRVALHASVLELPHPRGGHSLKVEAPLARDLEKLLEKVRSHERGT